MRKVKSPSSSKLKIRNKLIRPTPIKNIDILGEKCTLLFALVYWFKTSMTRLEPMVI